jgi:amino-acid N-acetyltransferase
MNNLAPATIRPAKFEDLAEIALFLEPYVADRIILPRTEEELARLLNHGFVVDANGRLVGFAAVEVYSRKLAEIQCLAVDPAFRHHGYGRQLIACCVQRARELGVLEVMAITASEKLFMSCGFHFSLPEQKKALFIQP